MDSVHCNFLGGAVVKDGKYFERQEKCECENKICSSLETGSDRSRVKTILTQSLRIDI